MDEIISVEPCGSFKRDVGGSGVKKIDVIERKGEMAPIEMIRIHYEDGRLEEIRRTSCIVVYKPEPKEGG